MTSSALITAFVSGVVTGGLVAALVIRTLAGKLAGPRCLCSSFIVSAALDEEGWVLLDVEGDVQPWPADWPEEVDSLFFAGRGWRRVNLGTAAAPREGWIKP